MPKATPSPFLLKLTNNSVAYGNDEVFVTLQGKVPDLEGDTSSFYFYDFDSGSWDTTYDVTKHSRSVGDLQGRVLSPYVRSGIFYLSLGERMNWPARGSNPSPSNPKDGNYHTLWQAVEITILPDANSGLNTTCVDFFSFPLGLRLTQFAGNEVVDSRCGFTSSKESVLAAFDRLPAAYEALKATDEAGLLRVLAPHQLFGFPYTEAVAAKDGHPEVPSRPDYTRPKPWTSVMYGYLEAVWEWYGAGGRSIWVDVSEIKAYGEYKDGMVGKIDAGGRFVFTASDKSGVHPPEEVFEKPPIQYTQDGLYGGHFDFEDEAQTAYFTTENETVRSVISKNFLTALNYGLLAYEREALRFPEQWRDNNAGYFENATDAGQERYNAFAKIIFDMAFEHRCYGFSYSDVAGNDSFLSYDPGESKDPVGTVTIQPFESAHLIDTPILAEAAVAGSGISLSWTMATDGCAFDVYRDNGKVNAAPIAGAMTYEDADLADGLYHYEVVATKTFTVGGKSRSVSTESNVQAVRVGPDQGDAVVNWDPDWVGDVMVQTDPGPPTALENGDVAPISEKGTTLTWKRLQDGGSLAKQTVYLSGGALSFTKGADDATPRGSIVLASDGERLTVSLGAGVPATPA